MQKGFNQHFAGLASVFLRIKHEAEFPFCLVGGRKNQHALSSSQAIGFQHVGGLHLVNEPKAFNQGFGGYGFVFGGGNVVPVHKALCKILA